jgi:4-hydroxybenzoate polyprenyltransferase
MRIIREVTILLRIRHYIKNVLVLVPLFFSMSIFDGKKVAISVLGFLVFSFVSSIVYILNDIKDIERDRAHSTKRLRPLASGSISMHVAVAVLFVMAALATGTSVLLTGLGVTEVGVAVTCLSVYLVSNVLYTFGLKRIAIVDVTILALGFVLRVLYGAAIIGVTTSTWLILTVVAGSYYLGMGKRRNELLRENGSTRDVLKAYSKDFLDKNMYLCQGIAIVFYSLWTIDPSTIERFKTTALIVTVPVVLVIFMRYNLRLESGGDGDPTAMILGDKMLLALIGVLVVLIGGLIGFSRISM